MFGTNTAYGFLTLMLQSCWICFWYLHKGMVVLIHLLSAAMQWATFSQSTYLHVPFVQITFLVPIILNHFPSTNNFIMLNAGPDQIRYFLCLHGGYLP
jgi:hypothetical protein